MIQQNAGVNKVPGARWFRLLNCVRWHLISWVLNTEFVLVSPFLRLELCGVLRISAKFWRPWQNLPYFTGSLQQERVAQNFFSATAIGWRRLKSLSEYWLRGVEFKRNNFVSVQSKIVLHHLHRSYFWLSFLGSCCMESAIFPPYCGSVCGIGGVYNV
jgi:hypothetical protein